MSHDNNNNNDNDNNAKPSYSGEQSIEPMRDRNIFGVINRLSKLCIPNTYVWLFGFYLFFHLWLNLLAELTRFGDRVFYKDWWNARTIDIYWRTWNLPVHHWILRHLYYPLLRAGISKTTAVFIAFFFSAALHELVISTPFRRISFHAFLGMMAQAPLTYVTKHIDKIFDNALVGNVIFWILFCIVELQSNLDITSDQGWYNHMIIVDPSDSTRNSVYVGGQLVAVKTTNAGTAWTVISTWYDPSHFNLPYIHADFHAAAAFTTVASGVTTLHLIFGTDGGLAYSADKGKTWSSNKNTGLVTQLPNFICGSPLLNRLMIGLQDHGTRERTSTTSTTWYSVYGGDGDGCGYGQAKNKVNIMSYYNSQFVCRYFSTTTNTFGSVTSCVSGITDLNDAPFYTNLRTPT
eukprot:gene4055-8062_t